MFAVCYFRHSRTIKRGVKMVFKIILSSIFIASASFSQPPNFELWNKHTEPLYYRLADSPSAAARGAFTELRPGRRVASTINIRLPRAIGIKIGKAPVAGDPIDVYTLATGKTLYLRVGLPPEKEKLKETIKSLLSRTSIEADGYLFGPQVGPLLGFKGITEQGYSLKDNITKRDIRKESLIYLPK